MSTPAPAASPAPAVPVQATLPSLAPAGSKQLSVSREDITGGWTTELAGDGPLDITVACVGGGELTVGYRSPSRSLGSFQVPCDGAISDNRDDAAPKGTISVAVRPDGDQHWSLRLARGPQS